MSGGAGLRARAVAVARAVPVSLWLGGIIVASALFRFLLTLRVHAPWVFQDEAVYFNLARSLGRHGHFAINDVPGLHGFGPLYPALIAPAWAIFSSPAHAYTLAKLINAVLMSLAAIPTYVIARRLMRPGLALLASLFAVAIPSLAYTNTLLTENAFYPATMAAAAALFLLLERPTVLRQLAFFGFVVLAFLARAQGVILLAALVIALPIVWLLSAWQDGRFEGRVLLREIGRFRVSVVLLVGGVAAVAAYEVARGRPLRSVLGTYGGVTAMQHPLRPTLRWLVEHFGELDLYVGVIPMVAMVVILGLGLRPGSGAALRAFAASALALVLVYVGTASIFAADPHGLRIEERYMFHVAPLFFIALMAWIERGLPRPAVLTGIGVALAAALPGFIPYGQRVTSDVVHDAFALVPLYSLELRGTVTAQNVGVAVGVCAIIGAIIAVVVRPRAALILPAVVLFYYVGIEVASIQSQINLASANALRGGLTVQRNWVDRRVGADAHVALVVNGGFTALPYWENNFFNRSVGKVYTLSGPFDSLPRQELATEPSGLVRDDAGKTVRQRYVLSNSYVIPDGRPLARDPGAGMTLYETTGPLRIGATLVGLYPDHWSGPTVYWTRYGCNGGTLRVILVSDRTLYHRGTQTVVAQLDNKVIARRVVHSTRPATMSVPLPAGRRVCPVTFQVSPTAVPAQVFPGNGDTRTLGIRFFGFDYQPRSK